MRARVMIIHVVIMMMMIMIITSNNQNHIDFVKRLGQLMDLSVI